MAIERTAVLGVCFLGLWACQRAPESAPRASLIELSREAPGEDYRRVGSVSCFVDEARPRPQVVKECHARLLSDAAKLDADVVVVEKESTGTTDCAACVRMQAGAFRRVLPYERAVRRRPRNPVQTPATLDIGTGFVVAPNGAILTALHVVDGARTIAVSLDAARSAVANVTKRIDSLDVALLKVNIPTENYLSLGEAGRVGLGERVWTLGFPVTGLLGVEPKFTDGSISALSGPNDSPEFFQMTVPIQPGNSGGPLLTETGYVIGIVTSTAAAIPFLRATGTLPQGVNWAVKTDAGKPLFDQPPQRTPAASRAQAIEQAKRAVCLLEAVHGEGLLVAPAGFGNGFAPREVSLASFERRREECERKDPEACLAVAKMIVAECKGNAGGACHHARFARTILSHACGIGHALACAALRE